ncbi:head-tail adaptor protein [Sandarakinorhabdus sp.]|uniref:phage head completion protein n=1 Tax=Sandarakinorhabdus sp. TaxID=1916663 RepID=UPI00286E4E5F|nr:head-tail adaptor protein [Sandarakinorhabdus sp.]
MAMTDEMAGGLRERVVMEHWREARDAAGTAAGSWISAGPAFAAITPDAGTAAALGEARRSGRRWRVTMREDARLGLTSRLWWRGETLIVLLAERDPRLPDRVVLRCEAQPI